MTVRLILEARSFLELEGWFTLLADTGVGIPEWKRGDVRLGYGVSKWPAWRLTITGESVKDIEERIEALARVFVVINKLGRKRRMVENPDEISNCGWFKFSEGLHRLVSAGGPVLPLERRGKLYVDDATFVDAVSKLAPYGEVYPVTRASISASLATLRSRRPASRGTRK